MRGLAVDATAEATLAAARSALGPLLPPDALARWERYARDLAGLAPSVLPDYCRWSEAALAAFGVNGLLDWGAGAVRLAQRYQDGGHVAAEALRLEGGPSRTVRSGLVRLIGRHGPEASLEAAVLLRTLLAQWGRLPRGLQRRLLKVAQATAPMHPHTIETLVWCGADVFSRVPPAGLAAFMAHYEPLVAATPTVAMNLLHLAIGWRRVDNPPRRLRLLLHAADLAQASPRCAFAMVRAAEPLTARLSDEGIAEWLHLGRELLASGVEEDEAVNYFALESRTSLEQVRRLSPAVALDDVREVLRLYSQALTGQTVNIVATGGQAVQGQWAAEEGANWATPAVFAAPLMDRLPAKDANFGAYKVMVTHQTGHFSFGTYRFGFERPGAVFRPLRGNLPMAHRGQEALPAELDRYFALFRFDRLARDLFSVAEDARIDALVYNEYRGIRSTYTAIQAHTLAHRPDANLLPLREYLVEQLIRFALAPGQPLRAPRPFAARLRQAAGMVRLMAEGHRGTPATVEDAAEAVIRLYILMRAVPNLPLSVMPAAEWVHIDPATCVYDPSAEDEQELLREFARVNQPESEGILPSEMVNWDEPEAPYQSPQSVDHHQEPRPEQMQNMLDLQQKAEDEAFEEVQRLIQQVAQEMEARSEFKENPEDAVDGEMKDETPLWKPDMNQSGPDLRQLRSRSPSVMESITEDAGTQYFYDEWDYRLHGFRPRWCRVIEHTLAEGRGEFYQRTVQENPGLVLQVRRQFEMLRPQGMAPVKHLLDGEDFDLDALIESVVDKRSGNGLRDKIYWRRRHVQRNVVVSVLLDMSFSTGERVDEDIRYYSARYLQDTPGPLPPALTNNPATKRIIELEKESLVLLIEALERLGDPYGIYGFSSAGRNEVRFYVLKEPDDTASPQVKARIDSIVPLQGTRIGPAVRHAAYKLAATQAETKLLLLLTDGRPQDKDYGETTYSPHGGPVQRVVDGENEYAVHDTKAAFNEARAKGITPFVVSIDKEGHDYLRTMCGDLSYEVVGNLEALPRRLPALYRRLTTR